MFSQPHKKTSTNLKSLEIKGAELKIAREGGDIELFIKLVPKVS